MFLLAILDCNGSWLFPRTPPPPAVASHCVTTSWIAAATQSTVTECHDPRKILRHLNPRPAVTLSI